MLAKEEFSSKKEELLNYTNSLLKKQDLNETDKISLKKIGELLANYRFENRLESKGLITRIIIDSLELDYSIGDRFIEFDKSIH